MTLRVASTAWKIRLARRMRGDSAYFGHMHDFVSAAHDLSADVVVLPELHVLELLQIRRDVSERNSARYLAQYGSAIEEWVDRISDLSGIVIVGGSHFRETPEGIKHVCAIGVPGSGTLIAEKNNLTRYEREVWSILRGKGLVGLPNRLGVTICYDCEFPEASRAYAEAGTLVQCVPSWTETEHAHHRVRTSCMARALENTIFVVQSALLGDLGRPPVRASHGSAAIIAPCIEPFPSTSVLAETPLNSEGIIVADLDFSQLEEARRNGDVRNWQDRMLGAWSVSMPPRSPESRANVLGELN